MLVGELDACDRCQHAGFGCLLEPGDIHEVTSSGSDLREDRWKTGQVFDQLVFWCCDLAT